jgi:branched-chain amino acid transport system substrate-binding protein
MAKHDWAFRTFDPMIRAGAFLVLGAIMGCSSSEEGAGKTFNIGLLLPYTGADSGTATNFERAVHLAVGRANDSGGVQGRELHVVAADTHSDVERALVSVKKLIDEDVAIVVGPESSEVADAIAPVLHENDVAFLSPLVGAANDQAYDCSNRWFRLAPSARSLGEAVAKRLDANGVTHATILHAEGTYNDAFRAAVSRRFKSLGGTITAELALDPNAQSHDRVAASVIDSEVQVVVLAASPRTAALVVNEFSVATKHPPAWYLSPLLKTDLLLQNVISHSLDGALGVAPKIYNTSKDFPERFAERWSGDTPLEGAYFYYDAVALLALALEKAELVNGALERAALEDAILDAAAPPGEAVGWNQLEVGLKRTRKGDNIYYSGLTGPMLLDDCGPRRTGTTSVWSVEEDEIVILDDR